MAEEKSWQLKHCHGKARVRVARAWHQGPLHTFVEWSVNASLSSLCDDAFTQGDNSAIVATDTIKNTIYCLAKECTQPVSTEEFGIRLAKHFFTLYQQVTGASIVVREKNWERTQVDGAPHDHGFRLGPGLRTAQVEISDGALSVTSGFENVPVLKSTQSGFEKFFRDKYTILPDTNERILASSVTAAWSYSGKPRLSYDETFKAVQSLLFSMFYGPASGGVYSPSVQNTLYLMAEAVLKRFPEVESVNLKMPNLHFLPVSMPSIGFQFDNDVYQPTDEPHGSIEASLTRTESKVPFNARL